MEHRDLRAYLKTLRTRDLQAAISYRNRFSGGDCTVATKLACFSIDSGLRSARAVARRASLRTPQLDSHSAGAPSLRKKIATRGHLAQWVSCSFSVAAS